MDKIWGIDNITNQTQISNQITNTTGTPWDNTKHGNGSCSSCMRSRMSVNSSMKHCVSSTLYPVGETCPDSVTCTSFLSHCVLSMRWVMALFQKLDSCRWPWRVAKCWCSICHSRWIQGIWASDATSANFWRLTRHGCKFLSPSSQSPGPSELLHWCGGTWLLHSQVVCSYSQLSLDYRDVRGHAWMSL